MTTLTPTQFKQPALEHVLNNLCRQADFHSAALASADGLLVTSAGIEIETMAAVAANLSVLVGRLTRLDPLEEIVIRSHTGHQVVCRYFISRGDALILIVLLRAGAKYRRPIAQAVHKLQSLWEKPPA